MGINVRGAYFCAQAVAREMVAAKRGGVIINMSSQMGHVGGPRRTVYCASKHAIEGMTKAMAMDLAPHNIRVNAIGPTFITTPMTRPLSRRPCVQGRHAEPHCARPTRRASRCDGCRCVSGERRRRSDNGCEPVDRRRLDRAIELCWSYFVIDPLGKTTVVNPQITHKTRRVTPSRPFSVPYRVNCYAAL